MNQKKTIQRRKQEERSQSRRRLWERKDRRRIQRAAAVCLIVLLTLSPCISQMLGIGRAQAAGLTIELPVKQNMLSNVEFNFFQERIGSGIYYWTKQDGTPLFCVQQHKPQLIGGEAAESWEEFGNETHFTRSQYEMVSIVLQCCRAQQEENGELAAGEYLAGQAAIWGILSQYWTGTSQLQAEMEALYDHVQKWNGIPARVMIGQAEKMEKIICQAIDDYYEDTSAYVPSFASKYPDKAPVWQAQWQDDGSCQVVFQMEDRAEAVKDFVFQLPEGWSYVWEGDQILFSCQLPASGTISVTGTAPEDSVLGNAMPIGLICFVIPNGLEHQHMVSGVEITIPWSCYFKLYIPEPPEGNGSWYLPESSCYRHQEDFSALYGVQLEKTDGDTGKPLAGVKFQVLEAFDAGQLEETALDKGQIESWNGWKARCGEDVTDEEGRLSHWDRKEYHYEKTYCGGHPEPEIEYDGYSEAKRQQLEEEAWQAWEASVAYCEEQCDYHTLDGTGEKLLEADRNLAYEQFIHLIYGYTFEETQGLDGYLPHGESPKDTRIETVFCASVQAGGEVFETSGLPRRSERSLVRVNASASASSSVAEGKEKEETGNNNHIKKAASGSNAKETGKKASDNHAERAAETASGSNAGGSETGGSNAGGSETGGSNVGGSETGGSNVGGNGASGWRKKNPVWLTSLVAPLEIQETDSSADAFYLFQIKNHKPETPPEETTPEETPPEETMPEETPPEETRPEETPPEETKPEESKPEKTPPDEPGGSGGKDRNPPPESLPPAIPVEEPVPRVGWIRARYAAEPIYDSAGRRIAPGGGSTTASNGGSSSAADSQGNHLLPKTGDQGPGAVSFLLIMLAAGGGAVFFIRKRRAGYKEENHCRDGENPRHSFHRSRFLGVMLLMLTATCSREAWAEEREVQETEVRETEARETEARETEIWGTAAQKEILLTIPAKDLGRESFGESGEGEKAGDRGNLEENLEENVGENLGKISTAPDAVYFDENGRKYILDFCRQADRVLPEQEEVVSATRFYAGLESISQIPRQIPFEAEDEETGRTGVGQLAQADVQQTARYWSEDFSVPLTFYDYGADQYLLQDITIPGTAEPQDCLEYADLLLEQIGCSQEQYEILEIHWDGESYVEQGIICRDAVAAGRKLVSDYQVEYTGSIRYPETVIPEWEALYRLSPDETETEEEETQESLEADLTFEEPESESEPETAKADPVSGEEQEKNGWRVIRTWIVCTVSLAVLIPVFLYLVLTFRKKRKDSRKKRELS